MNVWLPLVSTLSGDLAHNPGMCPDWESNQRLFVLQSCAQSTEPHQPGHPPNYFSSTLVMPKQPTYSVQINPPDGQFWWWISCSNIHTESLVPASWSLVNIQNLVTFLRETFLSFSERPSDSSCMLQCNRTTRRDTLAIPQVFAHSLSIMNALTSTYVIHCTPLDYELVTQKKKAWEINYMVESEYYPKVSCQITVMN